MIRRVGLTAAAVAHSKNTQIPFKEN